jgi:Protein of unknown function (DUF4065)
VHFVFDIRKAIAATAYLCHRNGGGLNVLHLIKMLYAADREALIQWNRTITGDSFFSMKNGPVLSRAYDLMCGKILGSDMEAWKSVFTPRDGNIISLRGSGVDLGPLSRRETAVLEKAYRKFKNVPVGRLIEFLHKTLPEWKDPGGSSAPIDPRDILFQNGFSEEDVAEIEQELELVQSAKVALQSV